MVVSEASDWELPSRYGWFITINASYWIITGGSRLVHVWVVTTFGR